MVMRASGNNCPMTDEQRRCGMLNQWPAEAVLPANDLDRAGRFYRDFLGMTIERDATREMLAVHAGGDTLFEIRLTPIPPSDNEALAFHVRDIFREVDVLKHEGVRFEEREEPKTQDGIADVDGLLMAWFRDSEGNVIVLREG
jgi:catechol 2,3-dioxygenase-like lactoylglutathione lyase family enzyme